jgi:hypothetical protein
VLIILVYLCIDENIFMIFYYLFDKCVYIFFKMYLIIVLFVIWLIIKINMDECDILNERFLLCTNTLVFTLFCNCKFPIKKIGKCCPNGYPNLRHPFCIRIREHSNPYSYSSKNVVKGVIRIRFHANLIRFHP